MLDTLICNALIVDGSSWPRFLGNLGICDGKIVAMGAVEGEAHRRIDATGLVAMPGFIDMHSHADLQYFNTPTPDQKIRQGITTELLGQDGLGLAPLKPADRLLVSELTAGLLGYGDPQDWTWGGVSAYLQALENRGLPNNAAVLASHGPLRLGVMGMRPDPPDAGEMAAMQRVLDEAMDEGAFGLSTGLIYPPCNFATTDELIALNQTVAAKGGVFVVHQRDEGYKLLESFNELMTIAEKSGAALHISHLQAGGKASWPQIDSLLEQADKLLLMGGQISWDRYPYLAGCTVLKAVLPPFTTTDTPEELIAHLKEPAYRQRIIQEFEKGLDVWSNRGLLMGWSNVFISAVEREENRWMQGQDLETLAAKVGKDVVPFVCDLLAEEALRVRMISFYGSEEVLRKIMCHDAATVGTDGICGGKPHPRLYGTYPRFFEKFVVREKVFSLEEAVGKTSVLPAQILGIEDRGRLRVGNWADIVLMDLEKIADKATYGEPEQYPQGIPYVFVNGVLAVEDGLFTGSLGGRALRKYR